METCSRCKVGVVTDEKLGLCNPCVQALAALWHQAGGNGPGGARRPQVLPADPAPRLVLRTQEDGTVEVHGLPPGVLVRKATVLPMEHGKPVVAMLEVFGDLHLDLQARPIMPMTARHGAVVVALMREPGGMALAQLAHVLQEPDARVLGRWLIQLEAVGIVERRGGTPPTGDRLDWWRLARA